MEPRNRHFSATVGKMDIPRLKPAQWTLGHFYFTAEFTCSCGSKIVAQNVRGYAGLGTYADFFKQVYVGNAKFLADGAEVKHVVFFYVSFFYKKMGLT